MFEKPETKTILIRLLIIAIIGLLLGAVFTTIENFLKEDITGDPLGYDEDSIKTLSDEEQGKVKAVNILNFLKTPLIALISLLLWFSVIVMILKLYWGEDELIPAIQMPSLIIISGAFIGNLSLARLQVFSNALGNSDPILLAVGTIILLFGFVIMFYNILRYVWVRI